MFRSVGGFVWRIRSLPVSDQGLGAVRVGGSRPMIRIRSRATFPASVLLFAPASVLGYMSRNLNQTTVMDALPVLAGALAFALAVWSVVAFLRRRADAGTAVISSIWVVGILYYLGLFGPLNTWIGGDYTLAATLPFALGALLLLTLACHRLRFLCAPLHVVLSAIAVVMVVTPLWRIAAFEWRNNDARAVYQPVRATADMSRFWPPAASADVGATRPPDIYHFVFDRYGSAEMLARHYGVERSADGFLQERGFYVAPKSHSNYLKTGQSVASTFYMDYLDLLADDPRVDGSNWHPIFAMLDDHRVGRLLRAQGYSLLQFGSWWTGTHHSTAADENHPHGFDEFAMYYLRQTVLRTAAGVLPRAPLSMLLDWDNAQCLRVARQVEQIKAIETRDRPVHVFAHFLVPHDPFVFGPDGRCLTLEEANARGGTQGYVDQVAYANRIIEDIVTALQDRRPQPVILIQADEGPYPDRDYGVPWQNAPAEELRIKTGIQSAFYFPDGDYRLLAPDITPVNSYRTLFNKYFGTRYPKLPDRIYAFPLDTQLYEFHDVTERIRGTADPAAAGAPASGEAR
jgi:hypothetical protein